MRTLEIFLNGKKLCVAGVGDSGVLTAIVSWRHVGVVKAKRSPTRKEDLKLDVGGLIDLTMESLRWPNRVLRVGDEVRIRVAEADKASRPSRREPFDPDLAKNAEKKFVEHTARKLGWKIVKPKRTTQ